MAEESKGPAKTQKNPVTSMTGMEMQGLTEKLKKHKVQKGIDESLNNMHSACEGHQPGMLKKAYLAGAKCAEEEVDSTDSSDDNPSLGGDDGRGKDPLEKIIDVIRRGWPNASEKAKKDYKGPERDYGDRDNYDVPDIDVYKERTKMTKHSPDITI